MIRRRNFAGLSHFPRLRRGEWDTGPSMNIFNNDGDETMNAELRNKLLAIILQACDQLVLGEEGGASTPQVIDRAIQNMERTS